MRQSWYSLLLENELIQCHSVSGGIKSTKSPKDPIGNGTHEFPACSPVPRQTAPMHTPIIAYSRPIHVERTYILAIYVSLTLSLPMTTIVAPPINVIKWQMGFNSVA
jgi:hypothetical protein